MKKQVNILFGFSCVGLGVLGAFLPVLPSTCFFIFAAYFFGKSSTRFENWLLNHRRFGPPVIAWRQSRAIPRPAKWMATLGMSFSVAMVYIGHAPFWVFILTLAVILPSAAYIWTRPDSGDEASAEAIISID
jgi:uncharacterized membrane protein YbaN (DUF454 family)